jgi:uncharacterized protein
VSAQTVDSDAVLAQSRAWVERVVIGLNLCPFAKAPQSKGRVRYVVSEATDTDALRRDLLDELRALSEAPAEQIETTLLIAPQVLQDFDDYNAFLTDADSAVAELRLRGVLQVASFHPQYRFAGSEADDISNATNRSPYPLLHVIREASIARAVAAFPDTESIFETNIATMRALGATGWVALQRQCRVDAAAAAAAPPLRDT